MLMPRQHHKSATMQRCVQVCKSVRRIVPGFTQVHYLSGPINVKDTAGKLAQPGDLLAVEICNLGALPGATVSRLFPEFDPLPLTADTLPLCCRCLSSSCLTLEVRQQCQRAERNCVVPCRR